jgi:stage V sporulation protein S
VDAQVTPKPPAEEHIFRVRSSTPSTDLGSAIAHAVMDGREVVLRAVGAGAINQAVKALPIAKQFVVGFGVTLLFDANFFHGKAVEGEILGIAITVLRR